MRHAFLLMLAISVCACSGNVEKNKVATVPHNRTIHNPVFGAKSMASAFLSIDSVEITDSLTRLYMTYANQGFKISPESYIVANGKKLKIISADSIDIHSDSFVSPKKGQDSFSFILNFQDVDSTVQTIDFIEGEDSYYFKLWDIALNDESASQVRSRAEVPSEIVQEAYSTEDDGEGLDKQDFVVGNATIVGRFYGYHPDAMEIKNVTAFYGGKLQALRSYNAPITDDGLFSLTIPVTHKHQNVLMELGQIMIGQIYVACDDTVFVNIDLIKAIDNLPKDKDNAFAKATYYSGADAELNNCDFSLIGDFSMLGMDQRKYRSIMRGMSLDEYKKYIMGILDEKLKQVNALSVNAFEIGQKPMTRKIREMYNVKLRDNAAHLLFDYKHYLGSFDSEGEKYKPDADYYSFIKDLSLSDDVYMYHSSFDKLIYRVASDLVTGVEYTFLKPQYDVTRTDGDSLIVERRLSKTEQKVRKLIEDDFGMDSQKIFESQEAMNLFKTDHWTDEYEHINDTGMAIIRKMSNPNYLKFAENINNGVYDIVDTKSYWNHAENETKTDSLFVELIQDHKGKVVHIDFWSDNCGPCFRLVSEMKDAEKDLPMDSIAFVYVCDSKRTPQNVYERQCAEWGNANYRIDISMLNMLYSKFGFSGFPNGLIINKKGQIIKRFHAYRSGGAEIIKSILLEEAYK